MEFITVEQFKEQPVEIQKVFIDWWKPSELDLVSIPFAESILCKYRYPTTIEYYEHEGENIISTIDERKLLKSNTILLFTEGQLRKFIEDKTNTKIETSLTVYKQYALWLVKVKGEDYRTFDTREEDLLQAYWKVACMIAKESLNG